MALVWKNKEERPLELEVHCTRNGVLETVLNVTAYGLEKATAVFRTGSLHSSVLAFLDHGGELKLVTTSGDKIISCSGPVSAYDYGYATTDDENEEPPRKMPKTGRFPIVNFAAEDFDLAPDFQFPLGTPSGIISQYTKKTASQMKKRVVIGVELELELEVDAARRRRVPGLVPSRYDRARVFIAKSREHRRPARPWGLCAALWRRPGSTQWPLGPRRVRH